MSHSTTKYETIIIRHKKENKKKCSLRGLELKPGFTFYTYPNKELSSFEGCTLLTIDAPVLTDQDSNDTLLLIDGTWSYAAIMEKTIFQHSTIKKRSIPSNFVTAYPRKQTACIDPARGLASIEALYIAFLLVGKKNDSLFENYYFGDAFIKKNAKALELLQRKGCK